jgi:hypothetical protein
MGIRTVPAVISTIVIMLVLSPSVRADDITIVPGVEADCMAGCRIKGQAGPDIYLGVTDLGVGENRVSADAGNPLPDGTYPIVFAYSAVENVLSQTGPGAIHLEWDFDLQAKPASMDWDALVLHVRDSNDNGAIALHNVELNGVPLGDFGQLDVAGTAGAQYWTVSGPDFNQDFALSADVATINLTGNEALRVELWVAQMPDAWDFGDAPDTYGTLAASDGARHLLGGPLHLGLLVDGEPDGQPGTGADGDDLLDTADEDGVAFSGGLVAGQEADMTVTASAPGLLSVWIDYDQNGDWSAAGEQVLVDEPVVAGANAFSIDVPLPATPGTTFARFRVSTAAGLTSTGAAPDGEVEDYAVEVLPCPTPFWDLNDDHLCDLYDILLISEHWNETGAPGWIPADADRNGVIDLYDVLLVGEHWNETW